MVSSIRQKMLNDRLAIYLEAEQKVLQGQSYTIGNRSLTRANLSEIRSAIDDLLDQGATVAGYTNVTQRTKRIVFVD